MNKNPIGVFDSGLGGLSVWKELVSLLPKESIIYYADSGHCPYGGKSEKEIQKLSANITDFLIKEKCKIVVVACNTATSAAIDFLRKNYQIPFVGMEPAIKPAALKSKTKQIGVLATKGTLEGKLFKASRSKYAGDVYVHMQIGKGLVELVESGKSTGPEAQKILEKYLAPMLREGIDQLVLGCTHYPFLIPEIQKIVPPELNILNPAPAVARQTKKLIQRFQIATSPKEHARYKFYTSGQVENLKLLLAQIGGGNLYLSNIQTV